HLLEYPQAKQDCQRALLINPNEPLAHMNLGYAEAMLGNYDKALESFTKYLSLKRDPLGYIYRAGVYLKKNDIAKAKAHLTAAEKIDGEPAEAFEFPAQTGPTQAVKLSEMEQAKLAKLAADARRALEEKDQDAALGCVKQMLVMDPENAEAYCLRARAL